ncbi:OsmC family protein [Streptomyces turgidiscabies]|uniref:OsmC-like protein n=1 Tax=Streptomyces turgidiscabies (strain Car8) TaxID=698760 RepID=L7F0P9_STRT8|nr:MULTISPECIES: OsmC family protein [Streptomyces]ELP64714.1 OsmC-like protein [Streptomyces turgidiscabies Car8]MDX3495237.1 OsmC family protein [Streptomyces turgidiscabies]GAQ71115.1 OsmC-like protein [Streptomyces turgidiscabies]
MNKPSPAHDAQVPRRGSAVAQPPGRVEATQFKNQTFTVLARDHELTVDQPVEAGGDNEGPTPVELLVASLASCVTYYAGRFLQRHQLPHQHLRVEADFTMADDGPARVASVRTRIVLPLELSPERKQALRAVVGHCTVRNVAAASRGHGRTQLIRDLGPEGFGPGVGAAA